MNRLPEIKTDLPGPRSKEILDICRRHEASALKTFKDGDPIVYEYAEGAIVGDPDGNTFLDIGGSYAATVLGHRPKEVIEAVVEQLGKSWHVPSDFPTEVRARFYELLAKVLPPELNRTLITITGADACDAAVLLARSFKQSDDFMVFWGGYHGKGAIGMTLANSATRKEASLGTHLKPHFLPFPYCYRCSFDKTYPSCELACLSFVEKTLENPMSGTGKPSAILIEPIQGHAGSVPAPLGFIKGLRDICSRMGILLIVDEIQTGFGRTGKVWAIEHDSVVPDLMAIGKGLGGGLPICAVVGKEEIMMQWKQGSYTRTFLTNSILLAAGTGALQALIKNKAEKAAMEKGYYLLNLLTEKLANIKLVGDIRGRGLLLGVELVQNRKTKEPATELTKKVVRQLKYRGILTVTSGYYGNAIKIAPPIAVEKEQMDFFVDALAEELRKQD